MKRNIYIFIVLSLALALPSCKIGKKYARPELDLPEEIVAGASGFSVWKSEKVQWKCGFASMSLYAGFPHLYWAGTPLPCRFVSGAKFYQRQKRNTHD